MHYLTTITYTVNNKYIRHYGGILHLVFNVAPGAMPFSIQFNEYFVFC